jgi:hypothetical protein
MYSRGEKANRRLKNGTVVETFTALNPVSSEPVDRYKMSLAMHTSEGNSKLDTRLFAYILQQSAKKNQSKMAQYQERAKTSCIQIAPRSILCNCMSLGDSWL